MTLPSVKPLALSRPRDPQASDLWRLMGEHFQTFQQVYDERFQTKYGFWRPVVERSVTAFLKCGDLDEGFARVRCERLPARDVRHLFLQAALRVSILPSEAELADGRARG